MTNYFGTFLFLAIYFLKVSACVSLKVATKVSFKGKKFQIFNMHEATFQKKITEKFNQKVFGK